jgi:hypothetical protein
MAVTQMWVHGNAVTVEPEDSDTIERQKHLEFGAKILVNINKFTWMHIPVPTPAILSGVRARLLRVFFLYAVEQQSVSPTVPQAAGGRFVELRVFDGHREVQVFPNLNLSGSHFQHADTLNTFSLSQPHEVNVGITISANFETSGTTTTDMPHPPPVAVTVTTAGADFET